MFKIEDAQTIPKDVKENTDDEMNESDEEKNDESDEDNNDSDNEDDELKTGSPKILLTAIGIGYNNLTKTLV